MQEYLYKTAGARELYQRADAEVSLSDSGCRIHSIRQRMQKSLYQTAEETLYQTADAEVSIRQRMQASLYQRADAGDTLSDSGRRNLSIRQRMEKSIRQWMQETLYQTADAGVPQSDS